MEARQESFLKGETSDRRDQEGGTLMREKRKVLLHEKQGETVRGAAKARRKGKNAQSGEVSGWGQSREFASGRPAKTEG